jgi:pimeloyl-ACP methyl ester carboxylesterase
VARRALPLLLWLALVPLLAADGPGDNVPDKVRPVPPPGVKIAEADRQELQKAVDALGTEIDELRTALKGKPTLLELLPDVQVYHNAVRYALKYDEFYDLKQVGVARILLQHGNERAHSLREGKSPWTTQTGLVVRGYVSKIDGSVQPYGLVVPASFKPGQSGKHRLDLWCHGRGETLTELAFVDGREKSPGEFVPAGAFVLHLYGRYCCANKFAGEVDCLEALAHVEGHYPIDEARRVMRGFSMGGAACWQLATHYPGLWCAAAPGAGFSETQDFLKVFQNEVVKPAPYEQKLWHMYDATDYAGNLFNCPTVAYSGEKDSQKQAADMMAKALEKEGLKLTHLIGPNTGHSYHPEAKKELNRRVDAIVARGRDLTPSRIRFTTYTLRYNRSSWLVLDGLEQHWEKATVDANLYPEQLFLTTKNVSALRIEMGPGECSLEGVGAPTIKVDGAELKGPLVESDRSWTVHLRKEQGMWKVVPSRDEASLAKRPGLQGPIDDAFLDSFLMVTPTGKPLSEKTAAWVDAESKHALAHWRKQFRGEARVKADSEVTPADIANHNLILWGDPSSNAVLARIADKLPMAWNADQLRVGIKSYDRINYVALLIYPNPLNPSRYVVLNSGFTFREYDYLNNARQVPKLPDYAVVDVTTPPSSRTPGRIVDAGFFDERWQMPAK